ncbi:6-phosphofructokinase [Botrimarina hoheduenensis]|uniref:ATP-dependent 6-phosphofructokinase n=1 Tax=Botrimarina hoheduenensis TaxID=2528000 RepID=A0A5C5WAM8_9BACT|nr:ATP-dependent 6-phosphofructokinase [Botrimarina hoheduenensis]TWT47740.1 6-phosphofructokinase 1 [Botrimarina hoheduenensis]
MTKKRIGILTSGGDCPGLNAVIRGAVKACHQLGYDCVGFLKGYEGLYDPVQYVHLTPRSTAGILSQGGTILGSTNKGRFAATVGVQDRVEIAPDLIAGVKQTIEQLGIDGLICVGGDGSLAVAQQFHENGINVVGVPKTIDNDLSATAFTFGFDSAIECATDALDRLHTTAASHERIMVLEVMGRHAGWIALHAGIAGGGDVILIPEIKWDYDHVCHKILHRESQGKKFTLVVVAEGAHLPDGGLVGEERAGQQMKLGGVGRAVTDEIAKRLHRETRLSVLGHLQRGGKPTTFDRVLATQFGAHAVRLIKEQRFGEMICSRPPEMTSVPIMEAVNVLRQVDQNGPAVQAARALGISFGDRPADALGHDVFSSEAYVNLAAGPTEEVQLVAGMPIETLEVGAAVAAIAVDEITVEVPAVAEAPAEEAVVAEAVAEETEPQASAETAMAQPAETEAKRPDAITTTEPVAQKIVIDPTAETAADDEDHEVEAVAESLLEMLDEVDTATQGPLEALKEEEASTDTEASDDEETTAKAIVEESGAATDAEDPIRRAQAQLAKRIAEAAQARRDEAPASSTVSADLGAIDVAELVKQKLAAASTSADPAPAAKPPLTESAESDLEEDSVEQARAALEAALTE